MAKIDLAQAPPVSLPLRFLLSAPAWGVVAGGLLAIDGAALLQSRWAPGTLALVHAVTLGLLGNAMFGSVLQFLPAAAGVRVCGGLAAARMLHALLNAGTLLLVLGFRNAWHGPLALAGVLLAGAFALLACMALPGIARELRQGVPLWPLHLGLAAALVAAPITAALGVAMLAGMIAGAGLPLFPWVDVHAGWGLLGWTGGLLLSVGSVVMPMFQGTRPVPASVQLACVFAVLAVLAIAAVQAAGGTAAGVLLPGAGAWALVVAVAALWLQARAPHVRNRWLVQGWRAGLSAIAVAGAMLIWNAPAVWIGVLLLGIALPWLVAGMLLEIVAFLAWIRLHRDCPRGVRLPPVQALITDGSKARIFGAQCVGAVAFLAAAAWPGEASARIAGVALLLSQAMLWVALHAAGRRAEDFLAGPSRLNAGTRT